MPYSLVNTPVLGFDLCRLPGGSRAAEILLTALVAGRAELETLAGQHPGRRHADRVRTVVALGSPRPKTTSQLRSVLTGPERTAAIVAALEQGLIGDLVALDRFLRDDVLDWTWAGTGDARSQDAVAEAASDVLAGALAAWYSREILSDALVAELVAPWTGATRAMELRSGSLGPHEDRVRGVLARVTLLDDAHRSALRTDLRGRAASFGWSAAMHDASWAVYLAGRLRPAASAQLHAVRAFQTAGFTSNDGAYGVWNLVSGVVHSLVVADLLDDDAARVLQADWIRLVGPL